MYEGFYGLKADPFRLSADHRFCYSHRSYARAKAYIQYALYRAEGFVMVTGRPGTGKTTLVNDLLSTLPNKEVVAGTLVSTQLEAEDLLLMAAHAFGLDVESPQKAVVLQHLIEFFNEQHRKGLRTLLIIDEAQDLAPSALEELRLLTNLQHKGEPLLQIALLGQDSLREIVRVPAMEQVHQRLIAAWRLEPLSPEETIGYVRHRLECAGWKGDPAFEPGVLPIVHEFSQGVPRRVNLICSRLLLHGYIGRRHTLTAEDAETVTGELHDEELALPDYGDAPGQEGASGKSGVGDSAAEEKHAGIWGEIDRGLFAAAAEPEPQGSDRASKASASAPAPRAQQVDTQPSAAAPPPKSPTQVTKPPKASKPPETSKVTRDQPPLAAAHADHRVEPRFTGAAAAPATEPNVRIVPEMDARQRNQREQPADQGTGWLLPGKGRSRLLPWIIVLSLTWIALAAVFWLSRGTMEDAPAAGVPPWWNETVANDRNGTRSVPAEEGGSERAAAPDDGEPSVAPGSVAADDPGTRTLPPAEPGPPPRLSAPATAPAPSGSVDRPPTSTPSGSESELLLRGQVFFRVNSTAVDSQFDALLDEIAEVLAQSAEAYAEIIGYTDRYGPVDYNLALSRQRAQSVANRLFQRGIAEDRLRIEGQGPIDHRADAELSRDEARMVEISVMTVPRD
jgi:general secretion pathway protein A